MSSAGGAQRRGLDGAEQSAKIDVVMAAWSAPEHQFTPSARGDLPGPISSADVNRRPTSIGRRDCHRTSWQASGDTVPRCAEAMATRARREGVLLAQRGDVRRIPPTLLAPARTHP